MTLKEILEEKNITTYALSKKSGISYSTLRDLISGKANLGDCRILTLYRLAFALNMTMDELYNKVCK